MKTIVTLVWCLLPIVTLAAIPNTFTAGTPSSAAEVNANFVALDKQDTALDKKIIEVEKKAVGLETRTTDLENKHRNCEILSTATKIPSTPGDLITIGTTVIPIMKIPFVDMITGTRYSIQLPAGPPPYASKPMALDKSFTTRLIDPTSFCATQTVSGYPATNIPIIVTRKITTNYNWTNSTSIVIAKTVDILVGETVVSILFEFSIPEHPQFTPPVDDYDLVNNYDTNLMVYPATMVQKIDNLVNYIEILPLP